MKKICLFILLTVITTFSLMPEDVMKIEIGNVKINSPVGWIAQYTKSPQVFFLYSPVEENDTFQENCNLTIENLPGKYSIKNYMIESIKQIKKVYKDLKIIETSDNYHIISGDVNGNIVQQIQFFYIKNNIAYVLTFTSTPEKFNDYTDTFKIIAKSFEIK